MKILLINYAYFITGGPERYMFNVKKILEDNGHEVIPFSMQSNENINSKYSRFFAKSINSDGSWYFAGSRDIKSKFRQLGRLFYSFHVKKQLTNLIQETKPDIAYVLHYHKKLSPSIISACKENSVPVVVRVSDYLMMCPQAHFFRDHDICELCKKSTFSSLRYRCVKRSYIASLLWILANKVHWFIDSYRKIDKLILTNKFMENKINEYFPNVFDTTVIPTFVLKMKTNNNGHKFKSKQIAYIGRITEFKGVLLLLRAFDRLKNKNPNDNTTLVIVGRDEIGINSYLDALSFRTRKSISILSQVDFEKVKEIYIQSKFIVFPVIWYENLPNVVLESFALNTPVIASKIGMIKELVIDGINGLTFTANDEVALMDRILSGISISKESYAKLQKGCSETIEKKYNVSYHYEKLIETFIELKK